MALYTIGDPHLSLGTSKPMDVFGGAWAGYVDKLAQGLSVLRPEDTLVVAVAIITVYLKDGAD